MFAETYNKREAGGVQVTNAPLRGGGGRGKGWLPPRLDLKGLDHFGFVLGIYMP